MHSQVHLSVFIVGDVNGSSKSWLLKVLEYIIEHSDGDKCHCIIKLSEDDMDVKMMTTETCVCVAFKVPLGLGLGLVFTPHGH